MFYRCLWLVAGFRRRCLPKFVLPDTVEVPLELFCTVELVVEAVLLLLMFTLLLLSKLILL